MLLNRNELIQRLTENVIEVRFTKADGSIRDMRCTLLESYLNGEELRPSSSNPDVVNVWDVDKDDWRAFRLDRVHHVITPAGKQTIARQPTVTAAHNTRSVAGVQAVNPFQNANVGPVDFAAILKAPIK